MKEKYVGIFWGLVLVILGGYFLITQNYRFVITDPYQGLALNLGLSALFFISYFLSGKDRWGWLFPACIFAGAAGTIGMSLIPANLGGAVAVPVLLGVAAPFVVRYLQNPQEHRWALIPTYVMVVISLIVIFAERIMGELTATLVLLAIALPFLVVYLMNRERKWALIPFAVITGIGLIPLLTATVSDDLAGVVVMALFALAFGIVYALSPNKNWWAFIPMGIFISIGITAFLTISAFEDFTNGNLLAQQVAGSVFFLGFALTFFFLWLRRMVVPTTWAIYPALVFALLAVTSLFGGQVWLQNLWPLAIIAGGLLMIYNNYRKRAV